MRRYGWTPDQVMRLSPVWRTRLLLVEQYETQVGAERDRREKTRKGAR